MSVCPLEFRYGSVEIRAIFDRSNIVRKMALVEVALLKGLEEAGMIPQGMHEKVKEALGKITPEQVDKLEKEIGHDVMALTILLAEASGEAGRYVHLGATSNDIIDTAWALIMRDALELVRSRLRELIELLIELAIHYRDLIMVGRTHGQHALPITLGFKLANYVYEFTRSYERLRELERRVIRGKLSGAVGTMAAWSEQGMIVEQKALEFLKLKPHVISTQVAPRDGFAEVICDLAILASQLDRLALEIRELMRPEILELAEGIKGRVGSSTMPHKLNPVICERISSLAKVMRGLVIPALENIPLWHERDLSNSAAERMIIPHAFMIIDEMLRSAIRVIREIQIFPNNMYRNLNITKGLNMLEAIMVKLVKKGVSRHEAHKMLRRIAREARIKGIPALEALSQDPIITKLLTRKELEDLLKPEKYLGCYRQLIERTVAYARKVIKE